MKYMEAKQTNSVAAILTNLSKLQIFNYNQRIEIR